MLLADVLEGGTFAIDSICDRDADNLKLMEACGITPGARLRVRKNAGTEGCSVRVGRGTQEIDLPREVAQDIRIVRLAK